MNDVILSNKDGQIVVGSREIADKFDKRHKDVLESVRNLMAENSAVKNMFLESVYTTDRGRKYDEYLMNRDGFSLLAMGFTGKKALEWKLKYIDAFNKMENELRYQAEKKLPTTYKEAVAQLLEEIERNEQLEEERKVLAPKAEYHDDVLKKTGLLTTTVIAKDLGCKSAARLNQIMFLNHIIYKQASKSWCPYANYEWLITDGYADYESYKEEHSSPVLKWTEMGRKWIVENYNQWIKVLEN